VRVVVSTPTTTTPAPVDSAPASSDSDIVLVVLFYTVLGGVYLGRRRIPGYAYLNRPITFRGWMRGRRRRRAAAGGPSTDTAAAPQSPDVHDDVRDAVTGQPLRDEPGIHQCTRCRVYYQAPSVDFVRRHNGSRCIACNIAPVVPLDAARPGQWVTPPSGGNVTTLANYRRRVNQEVVFEGRCLQVLTSRSGTAFAVMFERGTWTEGFKLVVPTAYVTEVGGAVFVRSLAGRTIRARGVVTHSPIFGYEISISSRSMILEVR